MAGQCQLGVASGGAMRGLSKFWSLGGRVVSPHPFCAFCRAKSSLSSRFQPTMIPRKTASIIFSCDIASAAELNPNFAFDVAA